MAGICVIANSVSYAALFLQSRTVELNAQPSKDDAGDPFASELSHLEDLVSKLKSKIVESVAVQFGFALISYADHGWTSSVDSEVRELSSHLAVAMDVLSALVRTIQGNISKGLWGDLQLALTEKLEQATIARLLANSHVSETDLRQIVLDVRDFLIPTFTTLGLHTACHR